MNEERPNNSAFALISSPGMHELAESIQRLLEKRGLPLPHYGIRYTRFANGERLPVIPHTVRRQHIFFLHPLQHPDPNTALMMLLLANDALKRASAAGITLVIPYMSYLRQDRKDQPRVPISARLLADLIQANASVQKIITVDMHADQEQGFFSIPVDNLTAMSLIAKYFEDNLVTPKKLIRVVAPDLGGAVRSRGFAKRMGQDRISIVEKRRSGPNKAEILSVSGGSIKGKAVLIFEDMVDTATTILGTAETFRKMGSTSVHLSATHAVLSGQAKAKFQKSGLTLVASDSIPRTKAFRKNNPWLVTVSLDQLLADAVYEDIIVGGSMSKFTT